MFRAYLRPRKYWANNIPTFDMMPEYQAPYPTGAYWAGRQAQASSLPWLSVDEFWRLYEAVPSFLDVGNDAKRAFQRLDEWTEGNSRLAGRFPATRILSEAESSRTYYVNRQRNQVRH